MTSLKSTIMQKYNSLKLLVKNYSLSDLIFLEQKCDYMKECCTELMTENDRSKWDQRSSIIMNAIQEKTKLMLDSSGIDSFGFE